MKKLLNGTIDTERDWARLALGWFLLAVALLTPLAVLFITWTETESPQVAVQAPVPAPPTYTSGGKRDPFKSPFDKKKEVPKPEFDVAPPRNRRPPGHVGLLVSEAQLVGVVQVPGGRVAMVAGDGSVTYFLHEGDKLYDGYIREITTDSIKFIREIKISSKVVDQQEVAKRLNPNPAP